MEAEKQTEGGNVPGAEEMPGEAGSNAQTAKPESSGQAADVTSSDYKKALAEKQDLYDRLLRKQAELENFRKRMQKEKEEFLQHANADLIRSLLPTLDAFERALKHRGAATPDQFYEGVELIHRQLLEALGRFGLKTIEAQGKAFDPAVHQAVETVQAKDHQQDQEVVEELQRGYELRRRLIRPAVVKVAVHSGKDAGGGSPGHSSESN
ncbi:MAG TPA: nucleotide exchange factor GrpE [Terriglobia bacterium]|nr:nucleotide exchange factor GrpE [Terriglobia bacterium]